MGKTCWGCFPFKFGMCFILVWHMMCACYQLALWKNIWNTDPTVMCISLPPIQALLTFLRYAAAVSWFTEPALGIIIGSGFLAWTATGPLQPCPMPYVAFTMYLWLGGLYSFALLAETVTLFYMLLALTTLPYMYIMLLGAYYCIASVLQLEWLRQARRAQNAVNPKLLARARREPPKPPTPPVRRRPPPPRWTPPVAPSPVIVSIPAPATHTLPIVRSAPTTALDARRVRALAASRVLYLPTTPPSSASRWGPRYTVASAPTAAEVCAAATAALAGRMAVMRRGRDYASQPPPTPPSGSITPSAPPALLLPQTPPPSYQSAVSSGGHLAPDGLPRPHPPPSYEMWPSLHHGEGPLTRQERQSTRPLWLDNSNPLVPKHWRL